MYLQKKVAVWFGTCPTNSAVEQDGDSSSRKREGGQGFRKADISVQERRCPELRRVAGKACLLVWNSGFNTGVLCAEVTLWSWGVVGCSE